MLMTLKANAIAFWTPTVQIGGTQIIRTTVYVCDPAEDAITPIFGSRMA
jgi:hypothetical protein